MSSPPRRSPAHLSGVDRLRTLERDYAELQQSAAKQAGVVGAAGRPPRGCSVAALPRGPSNRVLPPRSSAIDLN